MRGFSERSVLVTGGAGFLGSHLCERLLEKGAHVTCLDSLFTGSKRNVVHLLNHPLFDFVQHDVTNPIYIQADEIFNLACPASPIHYQRDPVHTTKTSVLGAINVLGLAKRVKARVLQASTSEIYGDPEVHPQVEGYRGCVNPIGIRSCYDEGKRCAESLFLDYHRQHGIPIKIARIFNTYGPRMDPQDGRVISNFIVQALRGKPITIYGDGRQTRSFCFVSDLIDGLLKLMDTPNEFVGPVNVGNPIEMTVEALARKIIALTGSSSRISFAPLPADDPRQRRPDISLARAELGWEPRVPLEQGLKTTVAYFRELLAIHGPAPRPFQEVGRGKPASAVG